MSPRDLVRRALILAVLALAYDAAGTLGLRLAFVNASATAVWPPTGIALAALLMLGGWAWPGVLLGAFLVNVTHAGTVATSLGIAVGNTLEAVIGAALVRRFASGTRVFDHPRDAFTFAAIAGVSTIASATIGVGSLAWGGFAPTETLGPTWLTWWIGDTAGALVVAPTLLLWWRAPRVGWTGAQWLEAGIMGLTLFFAALQCFAPFTLLGRGNYPLALLSVPPLLWAAFRYTPREAATLTLALSGVAIWGTLHGAGPFGRYAPEVSLLLLQGFMAVVTIMILPLAAGVAERRAIAARIQTLNLGLEQRVEDATRRLRGANDELREQIRRRESAAFELGRSEARLREAQAVARIGSWEWDIAKNTVWWSQELYRIYGLDPAQFGASYEAFLERLHPDDREVAGATVQAALRDRQPFTFEHRIVRPDGRILHLFARGRVECDAQGVPVRLVGTGQDMTERIRIEEERAASARQNIARHEAEQASQFRDEFLAILSHELRNPLTAIVGWARLLRDGSLDPADWRRGIEAINRNADLQSQLILDLLDYSRVIAGRLEFRRQLVLLRAVVEQAVVDANPSAQAKGVGLGMRIDATSLTVFGDPDRLQQVVANLVANAIRFTPEGGNVEIALGRDGEQAVLRVADDGPGIEPELLPHVFERYRRGDPGPARRQGGLGLGLAIVRRLVELHGGHVSADNRPSGTGAVFEVRLQLSGTRAGLPTPAADPPATREADRSLEGLRILLVEDDADSREALALMLRGRGAATEGAGTCAEGWACFDARPPDLLISDIGLPDADGYQLMRRVRARGPERGGGVPAIALTAFGGAEDAREALRSGYQVHVVKPFDFAELVHVIERLVQRV